MQDTMEELKDTVKEYKALTKKLVQQVEEVKATCDKRIDNVMISVAEVTYRRVPSPPPCMHPQPTPGHQWAWVSPSHLLAPTYRCLLHPFVQVMLVELLLQPTLPPGPTRQPSPVPLPPRRTYTCSSRRIRHARSADVCQCSCAHQLTHGSNPTSGAQAYAPP